MSVLEKIIKKEFDIEPFEVVHLYWNDDFVLGRLSGDFFFNKQYNLICIGMAGLVNSDSYIVEILKGNIRIEKQNRFISESTKQMLILPNKSEQIAINYARECGMKYLAEQKDGQVFAFEEKPVKTDGKWIVNSVLKPIEIYVPISFISFEDEEPYLIKNNE